MAVGHARGREEAVVVPREIVGGQPGIRAVAGVQRDLALGYATAMKCG